MNVQRAAGRLHSQTLPAVVVPVHNAAEEVDACLRSLRATLPLEAEVIVIDDASDDPRIAPLLEARVQSSGPAWRFERQARNLGFVATANRGMQMTGNDVVLLNSDTLVTPGWLEGLQRCLASDAQIATATPWTNNGEIASLPHLCRAVPAPDDPVAVARVIGAAGAAVYPELPTAVGFCMAISRHAIDVVGLFDQEAFGLGYGEENDFSMRARGQGFRNVLCDDVYVVHFGGRSFAPRGLKPDADAMRRLLERHPGYLRVVQDFIARDPLATRREALVRALDHAGIRIG